MECEKQRTRGPVAMAATVVFRPEEGRDPQGPAPVSSPAPTAHPAKAVAFWARCRERRATPGNCTRCGRPNPDAPRRQGHRGLCEACRDYGKRYKAARRAAPLTIEQAALEQLGRRVRCLELRCERFARILRAQYKAGYQVGVQAERRRWRNMPRDWDAWQEPLDIRDKQQHCHRLALATQR